MTIIILAGGISKRMWPIKQDKLLLDFLGKPLFQHVLDTIVNAQLFNNFIIIANPNNKDALYQIAEELGVKAEVVVQNEAKGMADAILSADDLIQGQVLIVNADDLLEGHLFQDISSLIRKDQPDALLTGRVLDKYFPGGYLELDEDKVLGIVEKPGEGNEPSNVLKLVVDYFKDGEVLVEYLKKAQSAQDDVYEVALDAMIKDGLNIRINKYQGRWVSIKYPWHVLDVTEALLHDIEQKMNSKSSSVNHSGSRIDPSTEISKTAVIEGTVIIDSGVRILPGAVVKGPVYIGKNCIIGGNSLVRESILGEGCVTGFNTEITRSYVGSNSWFHTNYVGDSVLEGDFGMGSGAVLANLRLDSKTVKVGEDRIDSQREKLGLISGRGVRIGVNASTMPGLKIGSNSLVGPGVVLNRDLEENTQLTLKQEYQIEQNNQNQNTSYDQFRDKLK